MRCICIAIACCIITLIGARSYYRYRERSILKKAYQALEHVRQARLAEQEKYEALECKQEAQAADQMEEK